MAGSQRKMDGGVNNIHNTGGVHEEKALSITQKKCLTNSEGGIKKRKRSDDNNRRI